MIRMVYPARLTLVLYFESVPKVFNSKGEDIILDGEDQVFVSLLTYKPDPQLYPTFQYRHLASVTKTDENGNVLWNTALYNNHVMDGPARIVKTQDDHYVVVTTHHDNQEPYSANNISLTKLEDQGHQVWTRSFSPGLLFSMKVKPNGNILIH